MRVPLISPTPRLLLLPDALDADGAPRIAIAMPVRDGLRIVAFASMSAALAAIRLLGGAA